MTTIKIHGNNYQVPDEVARYISELQLQISAGDGAKYLKLCQDMAAIIAKVWDDKKGINTLLFNDLLKLAKQIPKLKEEVKQDNNMQHSLFM